MDTGVKTPARGATWYGPSNTIDTNNYGSTIHLEGQVALFHDMDPSAPTTRLSGMDVKAILVRNVSGITLAPGRLVTWQSGYRYRRVDGYTAVANCEVAGVVDDFIPSANGVRNGDLFWLIVQGPCRATLSNTAAEAATSLVAAGNLLAAVTAAASTVSTTAGRFTGRASDLACAILDCTNGTNALFLMNHFARAISASTTADSNTLRRIHVKIL